MKHLFAAILAFTACIIALQSPASAQSLTIDNFNYTTNTALATASDSPPAPWIEFGTANNGYFTAKSDTAHEVTSGIPGGSAPAMWTSAGANTLTLRYDFTYSGHIGAQNLATSPYNFALISVRSNTAGTTAGLQLSFTDGNSAFTDTAVTPISSSAQTLYFSLASGNFTRASGTESFSTVFSNVTSIGFVISNTSSTPSVLAESVLFTDFGLSATPEPTSASMLLIGAFAGLAKRRRRIVF